MFLPRPSTGLMSTRTHMRMYSLAQLITFFPWFFQASAVPLGLPHGICGFRGTYLWKHVIAACLAFRVMDMHLCMHMHMEEQHSKYHPLVCGAVL